MKLSLVRQIWNLARHRNDLIDTIEELSTAKQLYVTSSRYDTAPFGVPVEQAEGTRLLLIATATEKLKGCTDQLRALGVEIDLDDSTKLPRDSANDDDEDGDDLQDAA